MLLLYQGVIPIGRFYPFISRFPLPRCFFTTSKADCIRILRCTDPILNTSYYPPCSSRYWRGSRVKMPIQKPISKANFSAHFMAILRKAFSSFSFFFTFIFHTVLYCTKCTPSVLRRANAKVAFKILILEGKFWWSVGSNAWSKCCSFCLVFTLFLSWPIILASNSLTWICRQKPYSQRFTNCHLSPCYFGYSSMASSRGGEDCDWWLVYLLLVYWL